MTVGRQGRRCTCGWVVYGMNDGQVDRDMTRHVDTGHTAWPYTPTSRPLRAARRSGSPEVTAPEQK